MAGDWTIMLVAFVALLVLGSVAAERAPDGEIDVPEEEVESMKVQLLQMKHKSLENRKTEILKELKDVEAQIAQQDPSEINISLNDSSVVPPDAEAEVDDDDDDDEEDEDVNGTDPLNVSVGSAHYDDRRRRRRYDDRRRRDRNECSGQSRQCFSHMQCQRCDCCTLGSSCYTCPYGYRPQGHYCYGRGNYQCNPYRM